MIEISSEEYWKKMTFNDAILYCSLLSIDNKNDWRIIEDADEYFSNVYDSVSDIIPVLPLSSVGIWYHIDGDYYDTETLLKSNYVIPVRDIN
jgi:hypothetical protein